MKNPASRRGLVLMVLSVACLLFIVAYMGRIAEQARLETEVLAWQQRVAVAQERHAVLKAQLAYVQSDAYVHQQARDVLNMVLPGDELVLLVERTPVAVEASTPKLTSPVSLGRTYEPIWRQWLSLFIRTVDERNAPKP